LKKYRTLLFDADDTLLDFKAAEKKALHMLFEEQNIPLTDEMEAHYKKINQGLWKAFEEGELDRDEVVNTRFSILFKEYNQIVDGVLLERSYRSFLDEGNQLVNGALEVITDLKNRYDIYIVTNGVSKTQLKRLHASGLHPLLKDVFVSEDTGFQKPMKEFFDFVFARIPLFNAKQALIIGDSLSSDIKGGQLAGLDTCWYNPEKKPNNTDIVPTYEIQKLKDIYHICF
jgi:2-haloacid dehalogenase